MLTAFSSDGDEIDQKVPGGRWGYRSRELCRNNAYGILLGCHLRQHKWQKVKMAIRQQYWGKLGRRVFSSVGGQAATFSAFAGMVSACAATVTLIAK